MATNNSQNSQFANNADGYTLGGGTTSRNLTVTGGNVTLTGAGSNTYTMPSSSDTLVGRASVDTLTNKTIDASQLVNGTVTAAKIETQQAWQTPTLTNSWVNYGSGFNDAGYMKDSLGFVHLKGMVKNGTSGSAIYTLPAGYRPLATVYVSCPNGGGTGFVGILNISSAGVIKNDSGTNTYQSMDGVVFKAEN